MDRQYYIKKDPSAQESAVEWIKLDKQAFTDFLASPESRDRRFVRIGDTTIEAPEPDYRDWQKEKNHKAYLRKQAHGVTVLSLSGNDLSGCVNGEGVAADASVDMENEVLHKMELEALRAALASLDEASYHIIHALYLSERRMTARELAEELGVSHTVVVRRKKKNLENLKSSVSKSPKSQQ